MNEVVGGVDSVIHLAARAGGIQFQQEMEKTSSPRTAASPTTSWPHAHEPK